jgi:putative transposase
VYWLLGISVLKEEDKVLCGKAERLMRTMKEEGIDLSEYENDADAVRQVGRFLDEVSMHKRIHSSLGYLTPAEFESHWRNEQAHQHADLALLE